MPGLLDVDWTFTYTGISRTVALRCDAVAVAVDPQPRDRRQRGLQLRDSRGCAAYEGRGQARMEMGSEHREVVPIIGADGVASITLAILIGYLRPLQDGKHQTCGLHARLSEPRSTLPCPF